MVDLVVAWVDWLYIKIASKIDKEFAIKAEAKQVILEIIVVDGIDKVDKSDEDDKYRGIVLSWQIILIIE